MADFQLSREKPVETTIYALCAPDGAIRYIGKTSGKTSRRLAAHIQDGVRGVVSYKANWIRSILAKNERPIIVPLQRVIGDGNAEEIAKIAECKSLGLKLVNATAGGDGIRFGHKHTGTALENIASAARKQVCDPEFRRKAIESARARVVSDETREKLRAINTGRVITESHRANIKEASLRRAKTEKFKQVMQSVWDNHRKNYVCSEETRKKLSAAATGKKASDEVRATLRAAWVLRKQKAAQKC